MLDQIFDTRRRDALLDHIIRIGMVQWRDKPIIFKSGLSSHVYVSGRDELTSDTAALRAAGEAIALTALMLAQVYDEPRRQPCLIGIPSAGTPLATAAVVANPCANNPIACRTMRQTRKKYGLHRTLVDGVPRANQIYVTVDNTTTDGATKKEAITQLSNEGYVTRGHIILVDRQQGGVETLRAGGHVILPLLSLDSIVEALVERGAWPKERLKIFAQERSANMH